MTQIVRIWGVCNQNCIFCCQGRELRNPNLAKFYGFENYCKLIKKAKKRVVLSGSETTIYPRIFDLIELAKRRKILHIELQSNGLTFSYKGWAKLFFDSGVTEFNINFPSHIEKTNNKLTQTTATLKRRIRGVKNLEELGANIRLTYVMNSLNYREMPSFVDFVNKNFNEITIIFTYVQNAGNTLSNNWLIPKYSEISSFLRKSLNKPYSKNVFLVEGVPFCFLSNHKEKAIDYQKKISDNLFFPLKTSKLEVCKTCPDTLICRGVPQYYLDIFGTKEFEVKNQLKWMRDQ